MINDEGKAVLQHVGAQMRTAAKAVASLFRVPVHVTIVVRVPGRTNGHTMVTTDPEPESVIETIRQIVKEQYAPRLITPNQSIIKPNGGN